MGIQDLIVYLILAATAAVLIRYFYRQFSGKNKGCNCGSCPHSGGVCHCNDKPCEKQG
ncbi:MAG: FeoB-associated Cys-rich membrane protein [Bacteroidaceae bacterium]|nr:FeoB-associated Cys-rich membrane protein [Bacteroidaceae bacterium]